VPTGEGARLLALQADFSPSPMVGTTEKGKKSLGFISTSLLKRFIHTFQTTVCTKSETQFLGALRKITAVANHGRMYPLTKHFEWA